MVFRPISCLHVSSVENGNLICFKRESHLISRYDQRRFDHPIKCFLGIRCVLDHPIKCFFGIRCVLNISLLHIFVPEHVRTAHFRTKMPFCSKRDANMGFEWKNNDFQQEFSLPWGCVYHRLDWHVTQPIGVQHFELAIYKSSLVFR